MVIEQKRPQLAGFARGSPTTVFFQRTSNICRWIAASVAVKIQDGQQFFFTCRRHKDLGEVCYSIRIEVKKT